MINQRQGGSSVLDYYLKFINLSKYAPSLVSKPRDQMHNFLTGVYDDLVEECCSSMLNDNMNISHLMVHSQQVEESRLRRKNREAKRSKSFKSRSSKGRFEIQDNPNFKKRFSNQVPSKFPKARDDRVYNPKPQKKKVSGYQERSLIV